MGYPNFLPGWETVDILGSGGFSKVYKIRKNDGSIDGLYSALKVISVPSSSEEYERYAEEGLDPKSITAIFQDQVKNIVSEFQMMSSFRGTANIVSYEDHFVVPRKDGRGYVVLIRMELLETLVSYRNKRNLTEEEIIKVGLDICRALILCAKKNIVHRDIKPQNIFVNEFGDFKLGDFGIARVMDKTARATKIGTYSYIPPEVYKGDPYNSTADIYSLGLVLYWLLNDRRLPFVPLPPVVPTASISDTAFQRRLSGEPIPAPCFGNDELKKVVLKAVSANPNMRYSTAQEFYNALQNALSFKPTHFTGEETVPVGNFAKGNEFSHQADISAKDFGNNSGKINGNNFSRGGNIPNGNNFSRGENISNGNNFSRGENISNGNNFSRGENIPNGNNFGNNNGNRYSNTYTNTNRPPEKKSKKAIWIILLVVLLALVVGVIFLFALKDDNSYDNIRIPQDNEISKDVSQIFASKDSSDYISEDVSYENDISADENSSTDTSDSDEIKWDFTSGTLTISGNGAIGDYDSISNSYSPWHSKSESTTKIIIEDGITAIGDDAFYYFTKVESVQIPNSVTEIGEWAFSYCKSLKSIQISNNVTSIGMFAFTACASLKTAILGDGITKLESGIFEDCIALENVTIGKGVTAIGDEAFSNCRSLYGISIPGNVVSIGERAFYQCESLPSITFGDAVKTIGNGAFFYCSGLENVVISDNVTTVGEFAFAWCDALTEITIGRSVSKIGVNFLLGCEKLSQIYVSSSNDRYVVEDGILFNSSKTELLRYIPSRTATIYSVPESVKRIYSGAFSQCNSLLAVFVSDSVTDMGDRTFYGCESLEYVGLSENISAIGDYAFVHCYSLLAIDIPAKVQTIGEGAFSYCVSVDEIECLSDNFTVRNNVLFTADMKELIYFLPNNTTSYYAIPTGVEIIRNGAFVGCESLTSLTIPYTVKSIGEEAFAYCSYLQSISIPSGVTNLGNFAFYECTSLESVVINSKITAVPEYAFANCGSLTSVKLPSTIDTFYSGAFENCTSLEKFEFGGTMEQWGKITIYSNWNYNTPSYTVYCSDGNAQK